VARVILQHYVTRWKPSLRVSRVALEELLGYGLGLQVKRIFQYATANIDNLVVGRLLGVAQLGIYDKAFSTMNRIVARLTLGQAPFRIFSIIHEDVDRFGRAYCRLILSISLIGFPVMAGCIVAAKPLVLVLYGEKWLPAVLPFQFLCLGGMLKLLDAYASQAIEASGGIWKQARRQFVGAVLVTIGAAAGSYYGGVSGAAFGVLLAMVSLTISMQMLVRRATGLSWRSLLQAQLPALATTAIVVCVLLATEAGMAVVAPTAVGWQLLLAEVLMGGIVYGSLVIFSPFGTVRDVVRETAEDMLPAPALRVFNRLTAMVQA
jgi:O-antigen/teichoic acid export membrane protein